MRNIEKYWRRKFDQLALKDLPGWQRSNWWYAYIIDNQRRYLAQNLKRYYKQGLNNLLIADLGCGSGLYFELLSKMGGTIVGFDFSLKALGTIGPDRTEQMIGLVGGDVLSLPIRQNVFDVVLLFGVLQTAENPGKYLENISKAMKPGGMLLMTTLRQHSIWELPFWPVHVLSAQGCFPGLKSRESELIKSRDILLPRLQDEKCYPLKRYEQNQLKNWLLEYGFHKTRFSYDGPVTILPHISNSIMIYVRAIKK